MGILDMARDLVSGRRDAPDWAHDVAAAAVKRDMVQDPEIVSRRFLADERANGGRGNLMELYAEGIRRFMKSDVSDAAGEKVGQDAKRAAVQQMLVGDKQLAQRYARVEGIDSMGVPPVALGSRLEWIAKAEKAGGEALPPPAAELRSPERMAWEERDREDRKVYGGAFEMLSRKDADVSAAVGMVARGSASSDVHAEARTMFRDDLHGARGGANMMGEAKLHFVSSMDGACRGSAPVVGMEAKAAREMEAAARARGRDRAERMSSERRDFDRGYRDRESGVSRWSGAGKGGLRPEFGISPELGMLATQVARGRGR